MSGRGGRRAHLRGHPLYLRAAKVSPKESRVSGARATASPLWSFIRAGGTGTKQLPGVWPRETSGAEIRRQVGLETPRSCKFAAGFLVRAKL